MDDIRTHALRALAEARGVAPEDLDLDEPLGDEEEDEAVEALCREAGVEVGALFPVAAAAKRNELAVAGLRRLAPLSPRAAQRLGEMRVRWEVPTVGSFLRSLEERRPVASGLWEETPDRPIPPGGTVARFAAWTLIPAAALTLATWAGCNPACQVCPTLGEAARFPGLALPLAAVTAWHALMLLAAWRELGRVPAGVSAAPL